MAKIDKHEAGGRNQLVISHVFGCPDGYGFSKTTINGSTPVSISVDEDTQYRLVANVECYFQFSDGYEPVLTDEDGSMLPEYTPEVFRTLGDTTTLSVLGSGAGAIWVSEMRDR